MAFVLYSSLFIFRHDFQGMACYLRRTFNPLSESPSTQDSRITMVDFCLCSTSRSHSQAGLYHYHHSKILAWAYLRTPPLLFRRHPPQINYPPRSVPPPPPHLACPRVLRMLYSTWLLLSIAQFLLYPESLEIRFTFLSFCHVLNSF